MYSIADEHTEFLINDRLSFQRFLGLTLNSKVPDAKTIWLYKDLLTKSGREKELFDLFVRKMDEIGIVTRNGSLVDASFAEAPRQRNSREENKTIKEGRIPEEWEGDDKKSRNKIAQKDTDARWTKKRDETHFGYKDHVKVDEESKIITDFTVTNAAVHDSQELAELIDAKDTVVYADSAYVGEKLLEEIKHAYPEIELKVIEKATVVLTLKNLAYNMSRFSFLSRQKKSSTIS